MDRNRIIGLSAVMVALLLNLFVSVYITGLVVSDTDPTTYIIVVMLMLFVFTAMYVKDKLLVPRVKRTGVAAGAVLLAFYVLAVSYSRAWLSMLFMSYRVDMLLLPLFLMSVIVAVYGFDGVRRMKLLIIYSVFASPLLLLPVLNLNPQFALFNAYAVSGMSGAIGLPLVQSGILLTAPSSSTISISSTCADIGAFAALVMFMVPLAYLYDGKLWKKALWMAAGVALLLLFNLVRMVSIVLIWLYYGITNAVYVFHLFAGEILFVIAIVVMMLIAFKFGMRMPQAAPRKTNARRRAMPSRKVSYAPLAIAAAFGIVGLVLSLPYLGSINIHAGAGAPSVPAYSRLDAYVLSTLEYAHENITQLGNTNTSMSFVLGDLANGSRQVFVVVNYTPRVTYPASLALENETSRSTALLRSGIAVRSVIMESGNATFAASYFSAPYNGSSGTAGLSYLFLQEVNATYPECTQAALVPPVDAFEAAVYDALHFSYSNGVMCEAYAVANSIT